MTKKQFKMSYSDMEDNVATLEFETEQYKRILQKIYLHLMHKSDAERIECLKKVYEWLKKGFEFKLCSNGYNYLYKNNELYITEKGDYVLLEQKGDVVELLNELAEENEQLKQFIQELTTKGTGKIHLYLQSQCDDYFYGWCVNEMLKQLYFYVLCYFWGFYLCDLKEKSTFG